MATAVGRQRRRRLGSRGQSAASTTDGSAIVGRRVSRETRCRARILRGRSCACVTRPSITWRETNEFKRETTFSCFFFFVLNRFSGSEVFGLFYVFVWVKVVLAFLSNVGEEIQYQMGGRNGGASSLSLGWFHCLVF